MAYIETWYSSHCPVCKMQNFVCDGDTSDMTGFDIEGIRCWNCKSCWRLGEDEIDEEFMADDDGETGFEDGIRMKEYPPSQPAPIANDSRPIWELIIEDMKERDRIGREKYGVPLQAGNGRKTLQDLFEELLDALAYTKVLIEESKQK